MGKAKRAKRPKVKKPISVRTGRPIGTQAKMLLQMPVAYLSVLQSEAQRLQTGRGNFLTMLVQMRLGQLRVERAAGPEYEVTEDQLREKSAYTWYVSPELRDQVDRLRLRVGGLGIGDFFVVLMNEWLGKPAGLKIREP